MICTDEGVIFGDTSTCLHLSLQCRVLWSSLIVVDKKCIVVSDFFCHIYLYLERTHVYNTCGHNILMGVDLYVSSLSSSPN